MVSGLKKYDVDPADFDPNGIAESQTVTAGNSLALNGALCDLGTALQFDIGDAYSTGVGGVRLLFDAAGDINTAVFTITGVDQDGAIVTEDVTGVTTTAVSSVKYYSQVTEIAISVATATGCFVGTVTGEMVSPTYVLNRYTQHVSSVAISAETGTWQADMEQTFDNIAVDGTGSAAWFLVTSGGNLSADVALVTSQGATGVRLKFDSYSNGAELQFHVSDNPYR
jgi:hypothetical protein